MLKNAEASRPYGKNSFAGKTVLVAGVSIGKVGTAVAQGHLRQIMLHLDADVIGQPELYLTNDIFSVDGVISDELTKELLVKALGVLAGRATVVQ